MTDATSNTPPSLTVSWRGAWVLGVLLLLYVFSYLDRYILTMLVDPIKADLGLTDFQMSLILGPAFAVSFVLFGIPLGWAADRMSRRIVVAGGVAVWSIATIFSGLARSFGGLFAARAVVGAGEAGLSPAAYSLLADTFPKERLTLAMGIYQTGVKVGSAAAFGLGGAAIAFATAKGPTVWPIVGLLQPWQEVMLMVGLPGILLAALPFTFPEPVRRELNQAPLTGAASVTLLSFLRSHKRLMAPLLIGVALVAICSHSLSAWAPTYIGRRYNWTPLQYGSALSVINLLAAATLVLKGGIVDWLFGRGMKDAHVRFYTWLIAFTLPLSVLMFFIPHPFLFLALYGVVQLVGVPYMVYVSATTALIAPNAVRARLSAVFLVLLTLTGSGVGPTLVGALTDFVFHDPQKLGWSLAVIVGVCFTGGLVALRLSLRPIREAILAAEAAGGAPAAAA